MSNVKFVLNRAGVRELLRSDEMQAIVQEKANRIQKTCGPGYSVSTLKGRNRVNSSVSAETIRAKRSNLKHNTLIKAVKSAR